MNRYVAYCKIKFWADDTHQHIITHYVKHTAFSQEELQMFANYYCGKYGILECVTVSQAEYEQYTQGETDESNTQV